MLRVPEFPVLAMEIIPQNIYNELRPTFAGSYILVEG